MNIIKRCSYNYKAEVRRVGANRPCPVKQFFGTDNLLEQYAKVKKVLNRRSIVTDRE